MQWRPVEFRSIIGVVREINLLAVIRVDHIDILAVKLISTKEDVTAAH